MYFSPWCLIAHKLPWLSFLNGWNCSLPLPDTALGWGELLALVLQEWLWLPSLSLGSKVPFLLQTLARLLKSSHPEDLRAANKLIKEMVQEVWLGKRGAGGVMVWVAMVGTKGGL